MNFIIQIYEYADCAFCNLSTGWLYKIIGGLLFVAITRHLSMFLAFSAVVALDLFAKFIALAHEMLKSEGNQTPSLVDSIRAIPAAHRARIINSHEMKTQFAGKIIVYIFLVMTGGLADILVGDHMNFSQMVIAYLASTEVLSIIENLDDAGVSAVHGLAALIHRKIGR